MLRKYCGLQASLLFLLYFSILNVHCEQDFIKAQLEAGQKHFRTTNKNYRDFRCAVDFPDANEIDLTPLSNPVFFGDKTPYYFHNGYCLPIPKGKLKDYHHFSSKVECLFQCVEEFYPKTLNDFDVEDLLRYEQEVEIECYKLYNHIGYTEEQCYEEFIKRRRPRPIRQDKLRELEKEQKKNQTLPQKVEEKRAVDPLDKDTWCKEIDDVELKKTFQTVSKERTYWIHSPIGCIAYQNITPELYSFLSQLECARHCDHFRSSYERIIVYKEPAIRRCVQQYGYWTDRWCEKKWKNKPFQDITFTPEEVEINKKNSPPLTTTTSTTTTPKPICQPEGGPCKNTRSECCTPSDKSLEARCRVSFSHPTRKEWTAREGKCVWVKIGTNDEDKLDVDVCMRLEEKCGSRSRCCLQGQCTRERCYGAYANYVNVKDRFAPVGYGYIGDQG